MPRLYRAVFLDVGDTLLGASNPEQIYREVLAELDLHHDLDAIRRASRAAREVLVAAGRAGPLPPDYAVVSAQEHAWRDLLVRELLTHLGVSERLDDAHQAIWNSWAGRVFQIFPEVVPILDHLRAEGYVVGAVSNWDPRLEQVLKHTDLLRHFDFLVVSEVEGYAKPSPRLFERALELAGVEPRQAIHVGDSFAADVEGARGVGIQPVWLDRTEQDEQPFAPTIHTLDELLPVLEGRLPLRGTIQATDVSPIPLRLERPGDLAAWTLLTGDEPGGRSWPARLPDGQSATVFARGSQPFVQLPTWPDDGSRMTVFAGVAGGEAP